MKTLAKDIKRFTYGLSGVSLNRLHRALRHGVIGSAIPRMLLWAFVMAAVCATTAFAATETQPGTLPQKPGIYRFMIGDVRVTALSDGTAAQDYHVLLRGTTVTKTDIALARDFEVNPVQTSITVYLLEIGSKKILVDTGTGDLFGANTAGKLMSALTAAGIKPDEIDDILITHIHPDHVGGLVVGGKFVFPNAIVHCGRSDMAYFVEPAQPGVPHADTKTSAEMAPMLKPYVDAHHVQPFDGSLVLFPGLSASVHPGHTPGSAFYALESKGERIVFVGDIVHSGAVQFADPDVTIMYDAMPDKAREVRKSSFAAYAKDRTLIATPHLSFPGVGHVRAVGAAFQWVPIEYADWPSR